MVSLTSRRHGYSRAEKISDAVVHITGLTAAAVAAPALVILAVVWRSDVSALIGIGVYAATLVAMLLCSALYHMVPHPDWRGLFRRLDHSAIYVKIAGTYTPFTLLSGWHGAALLTGLWGAAAAGVVLWTVAPGRFRWAAFALYLAMGWAGIFVGWSLLDNLSPTVIALLLTGGSLYTIGTLFFLWERLPFHNTIWHVFVLAATATIFFAVLIHLSDTTPPTLA